MSLFGSTPPEEPESMNSSFARSRQGLFEDEPNKAQSDTLFNDDDLGSGPTSPWDMPTPRKQQSRTQLLRNLLPSAEVPEFYRTVFDSALHGGANQASSSDVVKILAQAKLDSTQQGQIMAIIAPEGEEEISLSQNEFNVFIALVGLAQEGDSLSLDAVDERRRSKYSYNSINMNRDSSFALGILSKTMAYLINTASHEDLPCPTLPELITDAHTHVDASPTSESGTKVSEATHSTKPVASQGLTSAKLSVDLTTDDPWNTPDVHRNHNHNGFMDKGSEGPNPNSTTNTEHPYASSSADITAIGTTSTFTTTPAATIASTHEPDLRGNTALRVDDQDRTPWDIYSRERITSDPNMSFGDQSAASHGMDGNNDAGSTIIPTPHQSSRAIGSGRTGNSIEENVVVTLMPEKEGVFLFQHHNYEVASVRRGSKVIRRYSDFVWLLECLHKRYPFRVLPLLPPKRVAVNGNHLSNDGAFIEKRRRGLARFLNALVRHPVLSSEQLVVMFLTVPTELSVWRKQATISVQDEFTGRPLPAGLEESLPAHLQDLFDRTRSGVRRSAGIYITTCNIVDRLVKRSEGIANDHARMAVSLQSLSDASSDTYSTDTNDVPLLNDGLIAMSKHLRTSQTLMEDEARAWDSGVLEDLKRQRDALVSLRELFDRREHLDKDNIPSLERRIQNNETKLATLRAKPEGLVKHGEIEKVVDAIIKDKESIVNQHNRSVFVKECVRDELVYFQSTQYHVSRWNQDWAQERVKYSEMLADNWRRLLDELDGMPLGE